MSSANSTARVREALTGTTTVKEKGPPVADGVLSVTPDTPEVAEWRSKQSLDCVATSSSYLEEDVKKPHELFGKFTWKIENFSEISKRELRSNQFDVGEYKWYILVYPQGCDVCNHLSLFLCVADYDKLLPGWSHFAQFTIAVVNKDPKKSKYSDTLHRFCKKEHDWGWKKFMELSKVLDGFTVADTLVIKAQVQVILDKPSRPFRCLDPQYRRELVRVYLTNVESICRRFCDERRAKLGWVLEQEGAFREWWESLPAEKQRRAVTEQAEVVLKGLVKQFFNEKEVTSTLVMDALFAGCRVIEAASRGQLPPPPPASSSDAAGASDALSSGAPLVVIRAERGTISLGVDVLEAAERASKNFIPEYRDEKGGLPGGGDGMVVRSGAEGDADLRRDGVERDERRLGELGRRTVEMFAIANIFSEKLENAFKDDQALKRQERLIAEEEEAQQMEDERAAAKAAIEREKRAKKKERQKAKKEAERVKKEAEDAERAKLEEARRAEMAKRDAEVAEKRRKEEAAAEVLRQQQQLLAKQRSVERERAAATSRAAVAAAAAAEVEERERRQRQDAAAAAAAAAAEAAAVAQQQELRSRAGGRGGGASSSYAPGDGGSSAGAPSAPQSLRSGSTSPMHTAASSEADSLDTSDNSSSDNAMPPYQLVGAKPAAQLQQAGAVSSSGGASASAAPHAQLPARPQQQPLAASAAGPRVAAAPAAPSRPAGPTPAPWLAASTQRQLDAAAATAAEAKKEATAAAAALAAATRREEALQEEVGALRGQVRQLESQLLDRDGELAALKVRLAEVQAGGAGALHSGAEHASPAAAGTASSSVVQQAAATAAAAADASPKDAGAGPLPDSASPERGGSGGQAANGPLAHANGRGGGRNRAAASSSNGPLEGSLSEPSKGAKGGAGTDTAASGGANGLGGQSAWGAARDAPLASPGGSSDHAASGSAAVAAGGKGEGGAAPLLGQLGRRPQHGGAAASASSAAPTSSYDPLGQQRPGSGAGVAQAARGAPSALHVRGTASAGTSPAPPQPQSPSMGAAAGGADLLMRSGSAGLPTTSAPASAAPGSNSGGSSGYVRGGGGGKAAPNPYLPPGSAALASSGSGGGSAVGQQNGISGVAAESLPPSYRNAAAGVIGGPGAGGAGTAPGTSSALGSGSMMALGAAAAAAKGQHPFGGSGLGGMIPGGVAGQGRPLGGFGTALQPSKGASGQRMSGGMDASGLDDFAHMNLIDDLLTE